jgi:rhamnosyltransferase
MNTEINKSKVLVLLATYNGENFIFDQVKSILSQQDIDIDLLISDDNSTDNTIEIINSLADNRIKIIQNNTNFGSAALNFFNLIKNIDNNSDFDYVAFSDQDDIWFSEKISMGVKKMHDSNASAYSSSFYIYNSSKNEVKYGFKPDKQSVRDFVFQSPGPGNTFILSKNLVLDFKEKLDKFYNIETISFHDWFIYAFARVNNYKWVIDKKSYILYRQHDTNVLGANSSIASKIARLLPRNWNWYKKQARYIYDSFNLQNDNVLYEIFNHKISFVKLFNCKETLRSKKTDAYFLILMINFKNI